MFAHDSCACRLKAIPYHLSASKVLRFVPEQPVTKKSKAVVDGKGNPIMEPAYFETVCQLAVGTSSVALQLYEGSGRVPWVQSISAIDGDWQARKVIESKGWSVLTDISVIAYLVGSSK